MTHTRTDNRYFPFEIQINRASWNSLSLDEVFSGIRNGNLPEVMFYRELAARVSAKPGRQGAGVQAGMLGLYAVYARILRVVCDRYFREQEPGLLGELLGRSGFPISSESYWKVSARFCELFPPAEILSGDCPNPEKWLEHGSDDGTSREVVAREMLLLNLAGENRALDSFREIMNDQELASTSSYKRLVHSMEESLADAPVVAPFGIPLPELLRMPLREAPDSLYDQLDIIRREWRAVIPESLLLEIQTVFAVVEQESRVFAHCGEPGSVDVLEFGATAFAGSNDYYPEPEQFSTDTDWMPNVVLMAKMVYVWLGQLSREYGCEIRTLDRIPDAELDKLARWGVTGLWLIGLWERSTASRQIKQLCGNPDAISSAYSLFDYTIAHDLGGEPALWNLKERALKRGIRLASDMVPNHTGIYSKWILEHPDWFVQLHYPPYPGYTFTGPDLSPSPEISLHIEDGYWERRDAAVVFKYFDHRDGRTRYIYHGNDGTSTPWNDTAQLDYLNPEVRQAAINTILHVARMFPIIRFDAAMTLSKKHFQRLWFPQPGHGGVASRAEHGMSREQFDSAMPEEFWRQVVDRVAVEASDTLLLAEAFWLMEGYFVRTLGMHRVYNSAFMNMLKKEENAKYRQTVKNVLEFNPQVLQRFVNFMNNPDEKTAVEQFGKESKYFGASVLLVTMPGLPMLGHGQVEGFEEKYGMEYKRAYWDESVDEQLVREHERRIFPLMRRRWLFSGSENFTFYDFWVGDAVNEDVYAYSNRVGENRALILFHNRYAVTSGWIKSSTSFAVATGQGDEITLRQTTLGASLQFRGDGRHYYIFRDYSSGLEAIRNGRELCDQGLYMELGEYGYRAFLDFREVYDDEFGTWGQLCHQLQGGFVASIDEEVRQIRFADLIKRFRDLLDKHSGLLTGAFRELDKKSLSRIRAGFQSDYEAFLKDLSARSGFKADLPPLIASVAKELAWLEKENGDENSPHNGFTSNLLAFAWLCLHRVGYLEGGEEPAAATSELVEQFGLSRPLQEELYGEGGGNDDLLSGFDVPAVMALFNALLHWQELLSLPLPEQEEWLEDLLSDRNVSTFICRHTSGHSEWFVKERWEILVDWLELAAIINEAGDARTGRVTPARRKTLQKVAASLLQRGETAGYRMDLFLGAKAESKL